MIKVSPVLTPPWQTYSPSFTGFSADPAGGIYRYRVFRDGEVELVIRQPNAGTSNLATFTITLPVTAVTDVGMVWQATCRVMNNGTFVNSPGYGAVASAGTTLGLFINTGTTAWGTANGKAVDYIRIKYQGVPV